MQYEKRNWTSGKTPMSMDNLEAMDETLYQNNVDINDFKKTLTAEKLQELARTYPVEIFFSAPTQKNAGKVGQLGAYFIDNTETKLYSVELYLCCKVDSTNKIYQWFLINSNILSDEQIKTALTEYFKNHPLEGTGADGKSAYQIALDNGFEGTEEEWLLSLHGDKGDKGDTPIKGVDYFTSEDKQELVSQISGSGESIPEYWKAELDEGVRAINTALANAGYNKSAFLFYSDAHFDYGSQMSPLLLKYLYAHTGMSKTFFGGDIVNSEASDYDTMSYLWNWRNMLKGLPNHHSVVGNHDDGNATNNLFSEQYVYSYLLAAEETSDVVRGKNGLYYYIDNSPEKTRYIFLDTAYKGMTSDQTAFLKETLIGTKEGWHIVVISHIWYEPDYDRYSERPVPLTGLSKDASVITTMLDNYNSRTGEYADCKAWVEFCVGGHIHYDYDGTTATGIPIIIVETDSQHIRGNYSYTAGTTTEASVSGIIADYDNHKIYIVRIGRGESREIAVTNYQITYTNVLPLALASDGVSVYNGKGYKENTRWSSSSNAEQTAADVYITGWIPCVKGDTVYLKNITMPNASGNSCMVHCFKNSFTTAVQNNNNVYIEQSCAGVWGSDGNLKQFTIPSTAAELTHIRIQCSGIDESSIITINEPIE